MILQEWRQRLPEQARKICFVGGGGKTTCMLGLAQEYRDAGFRVILTTTTHMFYPGRELAGQVSTYPQDMGWVILGDTSIEVNGEPYDCRGLTEQERWEECKRRIQEQLAAGKMVLTGAPDPSHAIKIQSLPQNCQEELSSLADYCLIEGDGSRRKPVKLPRAWEPVVPIDTDVTVALVGLSSLGERISDCAYNEQELAGFLGKDGEELLEEEDLIRLLREAEGLRCRTYGSYYVILNQADTCDLRESGERILEALKTSEIPGHMMTRRKNLAVILLAAGLGSRFVGGEKMRALMPDGRPLYQTAIARAEAIVASCHVMVTRDPAIRDEIQGRRLPSGKDSGWHAVLNPCPERGIASSMKLGIQEAQAACGFAPDGYLFLVCDQPRVSTELIDRMMESWRQGNGDIISAAYQGVPGNPKIFSASFLDELMAIEGDQGGRSILKNHRDSLFFVEARNAAELFDVDTQEDLDRIRSME